MPLLTRRVASYHDFPELVFHRFRHLGYGFSLPISFIRILTSATSLASLVLRSKSFSANDVMSQALLNIIFKEDLRGPRNGPEISKLYGVILDNTVLDTTILSTS